MITVIDYGMGNLRSVQKGFEQLGFSTEVTREPSKISKAERVVLPGVGAFRDCMANLNQFRLIEPIVDFVRSGRPFLGICLGMQLLMTESEEFGIHSGLDLIPGKVVRFPSMAASAGQEKLRIPQIGWNQILKKKESRLLKDVPDRSYFYFVHSYYVVPEDPSVVAATTSYGVDFACSFEKDNIFATQFHPEKSQTVGLKILKSFAEI